MNYIELSIKDLEKKCTDWAVEIASQYQPDLLIYVAKAGYLVAKPMQEIYKVPLVGISATREGNSLKEFVGPLVSHLPNFIRNLLISVELKSGTHQKNTERRIKYHEGLKAVKMQRIGKILIIDDSVDTGYSMRQVANSIRSIFPSADVKIAALNVWDKSESVIHTDYALYRNTIIKAPMSKDSVEYKKFVDIYEKETNNGYL